MKRSPRFVHKLQNSFFKAQLKFENIFPFPQINDKLFILEQSSYGWDGAAPIVILRPGSGHSRARTSSTRSISDIEEEEIICKKLCRSKIVKPLFLGITFQAASFTLNYRPTPLTIFMSNSLPHQRINIWHDDTSKRIYFSSAGNDYIAFGPPFQQIHMYP